MRASTNGGFNGLPLLRAFVVLLLPVLVTACGDRPWNAPYPADEALSNTLYSSFSERPKHLDPARSYAANEYAFIGQIYEPPLQYHFLKRPYQLVPLAAESVPHPVFYDAKGERLPDDAPIEQIAFSEYHIRIKPGMHYQPHPALAKGEEGQYFYHQLEAEQVEAVNRLGDFPVTGSREVTAEDFVYQVKRLANPRLHSPIASIMADYIVGFKALSELLREAGSTRSGFLDLRDFDMPGVELIDRYSFKIRLNGKYPQFVYWLAMSFFAPMPWEADRFYSQPGLDERNISLNWYPIGSGPYMLTENNPNLRMVLQRNPNFHGEPYPSEGEPGDRAAGMLRDAGRSLPLIERAVYSLEKESIPYWNKFLQGYYDTSGVSSDSFDQAVEFRAGGEASLTDEMRAKDIQLATAVQTSIFYLGFNMADPVIGGYSEEQRALRQAISIAVDFEEYISIFLNGRGVVAHSPLPPGIFGSRVGKDGVNRVVFDVVDGEARRKSLQDARKLMAKAGYPDGKSAKTGKQLVLNFESASAGPDARAMLNWMRKQFRKLGIQLVIRATDYNRFQDKLRKGTGQMFMFGWNADYPDPENFLFLLYGPNGKVEHAGENAVNYDNPEFNTLFEQMKNMDNTPQRQAIVDRMVEILQHDAPWIWGFYPKGFSLYHGWYSNVKPNLMANNTLKYKRIEPQVRNQKQQSWNEPVVWPVILLVIILVAVTFPAVSHYRRRERSAAR